MKFKICVVLISILFIFVNNSFSIYLDKNPHDQEYACNKCHGTTTKYGQPETGKHKEHLDDSNTKRFSYFENGSNSDIKYKSDNFITRWDLCDECHYDGNVNQNINQHMNKNVNVSLSSFNRTVKNCSNVSCHSNPNETRQWSSGDGFYSYSTASFVEDYIDKNCVQCHSSTVDMTRDTRETIFLIKKIYRLCMDDCHKEGQEDEIKVKHPLGMKPSPILLEAMKNQSEFDEFPIDIWDSTFTCNTCHDSHGESCQTCHFDFNDKKVYPDGRVIKKSTVFLRSLDGELDEYDYEKHTYGDNPLDFSRVAEKLCKICHGLQTQNRVSIENPHWERQCMYCHKEFPYNINEVCVSWRVNDFNRVVFRKELTIDTNYEIKVLCRECHKEDNHLHPVDVEPKKGIPGDIPLDRWKSVTCYTCHNAHLPYGELVSVDGMEKKKEFPLYRRQGVASDLCQACHASDDKFKRTNPHYEKRCAFCHVVPPELKGNKVFSYDQNLINRCNVCHSESRNTHPVNIISKIDLSGFLLALGNKINCVTCHTSHNPEKLWFTAKIKNGQESYCFNCH